MLREAARRPHTHMHAHTLAMDTRMCIHTHTIHFKSTGADKHRTGQHAENTKNRLPVV